jgi:hypothetical protein
VHIDLHERLVADALELVNLACLDHEDVPRPSLELLTVHHIPSGSGSDELNFVIRMAVRPGPPTGKGVQEEYRNVHVAVVRADEVV